MSDVLKSLEPAGRFANTMVTARYRQAPTAKINAKEFRETVSSSYLAGMIAVSEAIAMQHKENPYKSMDEIIGDLQLILHDSHNNLSKLHWQHVRPKALETFVEDTTAKQPEAISAVS